MLKTSLALTLLSTGSLVAEASKAPCPPGPHHMRADVRHIEAGGIGYNKGYTTLEAFFASDPSRWAAMPFLDVRGHVFNDGKWAANAGLGLRGMWGCGAYGINAYYDYRNTHRRHYNQVGAGLERLGKLVDLRINGYLPVGKKISHPYGTKFDGFEGNSLLVRRKYQFAMKGADAEVGFHFGKTSDFDFYGAIGPYYFKGEIGRRAWGGKARVAGYYKEYVTLELSDSWDNVFKNNVQGQLTLTVPFGHRSRVKPCKGCGSNPCDFGSVMAARMVQPVARQEIVVVDSHHKKKAADNFFIFVNNLSHSAGTFESPYATLAAAEANSKPGDYIYVFAGDGTPTGMSDGIVLQDNQQLLGSSVAQVVMTNLGTVTIPAQTSITPIIGNTSSPVIALANNNVISGFNVDLGPPIGLGNAIANSMPITNATIINNTMFGNFANISAVNLTNVSGTVTIANNSMTGVNFSFPVINITNTNIHNANYFIDNNDINTGSELIGLTYTNCSAIVTSITNTHFNNDDYDIFVTLDNASPMPGHIFNISSNNFYSQDEAAIRYDLSNFADATIAFTGNNLDVNYSDGIDITLNNNSVCSLTVENNRLRALESGISVRANDNSMFAMVASNNFLGGGDGQAVGVTTNGAAIASVALRENTLESIDGDVVIFSSNSTAPFTLNVLNNTLIAAIEGGSRNALNCTLFSAGSMFANIENNILKFGNLFIFNTATGDLQATANRNQFLVTQALITNAGSGTICQQFNNNVSNVVQYMGDLNPYVISNTSTGELFLEPPTGNVGLFTLMNVTPIAPGGCTH